MGLELGPTVTMSPEAAPYALSGQLWPPPRGAPSWAEERSDENPYGSMQQAGPVKPTEPVLPHPVRDGWVGGKAQLARRARGWMAMRAS